MSYFSHALERLEVTAERRIHVPPQFRLVWDEGKADFLQQQQGGIFQPPFPNPVCTTEAVGFVLAQGSVLTSVLSAACI